MRHVNGGAIPGLYGAGNYIASPTGQAYRSGGSTIGPALVYGHIAGQNVAAEAEKSVDLPIRTIIRGTGSSGFAVSLKGCCGMRRVSLAFVGPFCLFGLVSIALAQGGDVYVTPSPVTCATPPALRSPGTAADASPVGCAVLDPARAIELFEPGLSPNAFTISADKPVTITPHNFGVALHNFSAYELGIRQDVLPGETKTVTVAAKAGDYPFYCDILGHKQAGMVGLLRAR